MLSICLEIGQKLHQSPQLQNSTKTEYETENVKFAICNSQNRIRPKNYEKVIVCNSLLLCGFENVKWKFECEHFFPVLCLYFFSQQKWFEWKRMEKCTKSLLLIWKVWRQWFSNKLFCAAMTNSLVHTQNANVDWIKKCTAKLLLFVLKTNNHSTIFLLFRLFFPLLWNCFRFCETFVKVYCS